MSQPPARIPDGIANRCLQEIASKLGVTKQEAAKTAVVALWDDLVGGDRRTMSI